VRIAAEHLNLAGVHAYQIVDAAYANAFIRVHFSTAVSITVIAFIAAIGTIIISVSINAT
jgi:catalase